MKKFLCLIAGVFFLQSVLALSIDFSGDTSVYGTYVHENESYLTSDNAEEEEDIESTNMLALENVGFRFSPAEGVSAWLDASCYGSIMHYKNNDTPVYVPFALDVNQIYITMDLGSMNYFVGKKVFNYGFSSNFPLVNQVNPRRDDAIRLVSEGTGAAGFVLSPFNWISFSGLTYFDSDDALGSLDDISFAIITDFFYKNFTLSVYSYTLKPMSSELIDSIDLLFSDYNAFAEDISSNYKPEFPAAFSGSAQLGLFTLYSEILYNPSPLKFTIVTDDDEEEAMERVEKGNYWDAMAGCRFASSKFSIELEYCRAKSGYNVEEVDKIHTYLSDAPLEINRVYSSTRMFFKQNAVLSLVYMPAPELTFSLSDKITFPEFGCDYKYIGNRISAGFAFVTNQALEIMGSFSYGFGGKESEFGFYNSHDLSITLGAKLYY